MYVSQDTDVDPWKMRQDFLGLGVLESFPAKVPGRSHMKGSNVFSISKNSDDSRVIHLAGMVKAVSHRVFYS